MIFTLQAFSRVTTRLSNTCLGLFQRCFGDVPQKCQLTCAWYRTVQVGFYKNGFTEFYTERLNFFPPVSQLRVFIGKNGRRKVSQKTPFDACFLFSAYISLHCDESAICKVMLYLLLASCLHCNHGNNHFCDFTFELTFGIIADLWVFICDGHWRCQWEACDQQ